MMIDKNSRNISYRSQLAILFGLTGAGLVLSAVVGAVIWIMMQGATIPSTPEEILQPKYYNVNMVIQGVSTFLLFFLPAWLFAKICYRQPIKYLGFNLHFSFKQMLIVAGILLLTFPLSGALGQLNQVVPIPKSWATYFKNMELKREAQEAALIQINSLSKYILSLFMIAILPALFEEIFFRAAMQNLFVRWFKNPWTAIILTSIIFSVIHLSYYGFLVRFGLGMILGLVFYYSRSLWLCVLIHFLYNGIQVTALYVMNLKGTKQAKELEETFPLWMGVMALIAFIYLFIVFKKNSQAVLAAYPEEVEAEEKLPRNDFQQWLNQS